MKKLFVKAFGCQMNVYDSERMKDVLVPTGYMPTDSLEDADMVILNTCHIREKASEKVFSDLGRLRKLKDRAAENEKPQSEAVFKAAFFDFFAAAKAKEHTKLGTRLNYEQTGIASTFRKSGRAIVKPGKTLAKEFSDFDPRWEKAETFFSIFNGFYTF